MTDFAPIAYFAYKRPDHVIESLESLTRCHGAKSSHLIVFSDAPKRSEDTAGVEEVRKILRSKQWCGEVTIIEREKNYGCAKNIIEGVTEVCDKYGKVIVVEDDLILSQYFLNYMNDGLKKYENEERVMQVSAYMFPLALKSDTDAMFLPLSTSWGWATWKRAWDKFDPDVKKYDLVKSDKKTLYKFDLEGSFPYSKMLDAQLNGEIDSWAIRFHYSMFIADGIALHPKKSLVSNIGFDDSGTHCKKNSLQGQKICDFNVSVFPDGVSIDTYAKKQLFKFLYFKERKKNIFSSVRYDLRMILN